MNSYDLTRPFWDWSFSNPEKIKPIHISIFHFAIEHCNRLGWKKKFGFPTSMAMEAIGVKSYNTYSSALNDLVEWGFIEMVEKSRNQHSSNIIALSKNNKALNKALDKALTKHGAKQRESIDSIIKQSNNETSKPTNIPSVEEFLDYLKFELTDFNYSSYEFSVKSKYESWVDNNWKDGNDKPILNWKLKLKNTIPHLKPINNGTKPSNSGPTEEGLLAFING